MCKEKMYGHTTSTINFYVWTVCVCMHTHVQHSYYASKEKKTFHLVGEKSLNQSFSLQADMIYFC